MQKVEFMDGLPLVEACHTCSQVLRAANWQVTQCGPGEWLGLCVVKCEGCGNVHIAAAGSTKRAQLDAQYVREKLIREITKK
jgi:hypothetical protein